MKVKPVKKNERTLDFDLHKSISSVKVKAMTVTEERRKHYEITEIYKQLWMKRQLKVLK